MESTVFKTYSRRAALPNTPTPQASDNVGDAKNSAESESPHQENEGILKETPCSASTKARPKRCKRKTKAKVGDSSEPEVIVRRHPRVRGRVRRSRNRDSTTTADTIRLDTGTFSRYLNHIWDAFPEEKTKSVTYFDPWWFYMYADQDKNAKVVSWIKKKGVFSKKYVFVPVVMWSHWNLLIFCHLGQCLNSKTDAPCLLLLDSMHGADPQRLEPHIRRLLIDIYESEGRPESKQQLSDIPLLIPKVPQQKDGDACGFYVLYYMRLFMESLPESISISEGYPYFMKSDWFTDEEVESFSEALNALPVAVSDHDHSSVDSSDCVEVIEAPSSDDEF